MIVLKRTAIEALITRKADKDRKTMVLKGARQVGKTWLRKEFGKYYKSCVYFNFDEEEELNTIFEKSKNPQRIIELLSLICGVEVKGGESKSAPSFKRYLSNRKPKRAVRFSKLGYRRDGNFCNIPLYLTGRFWELL